MRVRRILTGQVLTLTDAALLGAGGEARVYRLPDDPTLVAKLWHKPGPERAAKVQAMLSNPPLEPMAQQHHTSIAWPVDILQSPTAAGTIVGFVMPYVGGMRPIFEFFNPKTRRQTCPLFNWFYLHRTARNLVIAIRALHERGYVVGDMNESNVLVSETALVTVVDTDSFQVWDPAKGVLYRCRVGKPEFTPPELQGKTFGQINRKIEHDLFGIGIILFQLLMEGTHPFAGMYTGQGDSPPYEQRIASGHFPYGTDKVPYALKKTAPSLEMLYPALQHLFVRCFQDGHFQPTARPDTQAWQWALEEAETALVSCWYNDQHVYSGHLQDCPWCERTKLLAGRDPFPSIQSVKDGTHLGPAVAPPKTRGRPHPVPSAGSHNLPPPPIPRPVPRSSGSRTQTTTRKTKPFAGFPGPRNDLAWGGLFLGIISCLAVFFAPQLAYFLSVVGLILAIFGEIRSHGWYLDGKGRLPARIGMILCLLPMLYSLATTARELAS